MRDDTIVAVASPPGGAERAVVRLSGPRALELAARVSQPLPRARRVVRITVLDFPALAWVMPSPASYTGEDVVELHVPGSPPVVRVAVDALVAAGARLAGPGEYTMRAYLHGKLDLVQAEAVQALIAAQDAEEARAARARLEGELSRPLRDVEDRLLDLAADVEASLDFVEEDIRIVAPHEVEARTNAIREALAALVSDVRAVEETRPVVLLWGVPNAGKSLLFNRLTGSDAIVSDVAGTTRDLLEADVDGIRLIDAAGPQEATGVDRDAVDRARRAAEEADLLLLVVDGTRPHAIPPPVDRPVLRIVNKCDLARMPGEWNVSARTGEGIDALREALRRRVGESGRDARIHVTWRQQAYLRQALDALDRRSAQMELRALDLREALGALGAVTGRAVTDEVLTRIFSRFCIGK